MLNITLENVKHWKLLLVLLSALSLIPNIYALLYFSQNVHDRQFYKININVARWEIAEGWGECLRVAPAADKNNAAFFDAGGMPGDLVCYTTVLERSPHITANEKVPVVVVRKEQRLPLELTATPIGNQIFSEHWLHGVGQPFVDLLYLIIALVIGWRGAQQKHLRFLSLGMIAWSLLLPNHADESVRRLLDIIALVGRANLLAYLCFAMTLLALTVGPNSRVLVFTRRGMPFYVGLVLASMVSGGLFRIGHYQRFQDIDNILALANNALGMFGVLALLWIKRKNAVAEDWERANLMLVIFSIALTAQILQKINAFFPSQDQSYVLILKYCLSNVLPIGLGYAVLRHRVFDLGFAFNRTVVYSIFVLILAVVFGFAEPVIKSEVLAFLEKVFPDAFKKDRISEKIIKYLITGLVGALIILGFRHIHHWLEHKIQNLFFHSWYLATAAFQRHIEKIAQAGEESVVLNEFTQALQQFTPMAGLAIYLQEQLSGAKVDADFKVCWSNLPQAVPALLTNHSLILEFRRGTKHFEVESDPLLGAGLYGFSLQVRGRVFGTVLLGQKLDQHSYRPDEIALICQACDSIALDLESLRVAHLQKEHLQHQQQVDALQAQLQIAQLQLEVCQLRAAKDTD